MDSTTKIVTLGLPIRLDFHCQNSLKPFRCLKMNVSGRTVINAFLLSPGYDWKKVDSGVSDEYSYQVPRRFRTHFGYS